MSLRLFVLRHAETDWSRARRYAGSRDIPLSAAGLEQCAALGRALATVPLDAVYASSQERARTTAEAIAKPHRLELIVDPDFREMGFGEWEGLTRDEVAARDPERYAVWRDAPDRAAPPGGEPLVDVAARAARGLAHIREARPDGVAALVTHGVIVRLLVLDALGLGLDRLWSFDVSPGGITEIEYRPGWVTLHRMNTLAHLDGVTA